MLYIFRSQNTIKMVMIQTQVYHQHQVLVVIQAVVRMSQVVAVTKAIDK